MLIELCCGSIDDCLIAKKVKVDRIELNSALELGGLTPTPATFLEAKKLGIPLCVMIRPRGAGFHYSNALYNIMKQDAVWFLDHGASGIVFGFLNEDHTIDHKRTKEMVDLIHGYQKEAIFHKAIDATHDFFTSLSTLVNCGVDRVLTSGGGVYPHFNYDHLKKAIQMYDGIIDILPGGGIRSYNIVELIQQTNTKQVHLTSKHMVSDPKDHKHSTFITTDKEQYLTIKKEIDLLQKQSYNEPSL